MNPFNRRLSLIALAGATLTPLAGAQLISYEGFNYDPSLSLVNVGFGGTGWTGGWGLAPGQATWTTSMPGMTYIKGGLSLVNVPGKISSASAAGCQRTMTVAPLGGANTTIWVSFLAQQTAGGSNGNWLGVALPCTAAGSNSYLFLGKPYGRANWGTDAASIASHRQTAKPATGKAFIVARIDFKNGVDDVYVWVNPGLTGAPAVLSADLRLTGYGNFDGITKVQTQIGGGNIAGNIDEIRVGRDFLSVAPHWPGMFNNGFFHEAMGGAQLEPSPDGQSLSVTHIGGTGNDGVRLIADSHGGNGIAIDAGDFPPGTGFTVNDFNAAGERMSLSSVRRIVGGGARIQGDFQPQTEGVVVTAVRIMAYDADGNLFRDETTQGALAGTDLPGVLMDSPCPNGRPRYWYQIFEPTPGPQGWRRFKLVWRYGCGEGATLPASKGPCVVITPVFQGTGRAGNGNDPHKKEITSDGLGSFSVSGASAIFGEAFAGGLGDAEISQSCGDVDCTPDLQQLSIGNIGGTGSDGVRIIMPADVASISSGLELSEAFRASPAGRIVLDREGTTGNGQQRHQRTILTSNGQGGAVMTLDLSDLGTTRISYTVRNNGQIVGGGESSPQQFALLIGTQPPGKIIYNWIDYGWAYYGVGHWTIADFHGFFSVVPPGGGGGMSGNQVDIELLDGAQLASFSSVSVTGQDLPDPLNIPSLAWEPAALPCPADFNNDGFLDFFDIDSYIQGFESGDPRSDFNGDGFVDFFDIDAFTQAFEAGC